MENKTQEFTLCSMFKRTLMEEAWFMAPMEKELRPQWNVPS